MTLAKTKRVIGNISIARANKNIYSTGVTYDRQIIFTVLINGTYRLPCLYH